MLDVTRDTGNRCYLVRVARGKIGNALPRWDFQTERYVGAGVGVFKHEIAVPDKRRQHMLRKLLGVAAALALPAVLVAQTPKSSTAGAVRGKAIHFQGEVVRPADAVRTAGDVDHNQSDGAKA